MTSVLLVDNHEVVCEGLKAMLTDGTNIEVVGTAYNGNQAITMTRELAPDIVLMDVRMPVLDGVAACREIRQSSPASKVIMLSTYDDDKDVFGSIDAGASGYIIKDTSTNDLVRAIDIVASGQSFFHPIISRKIADKMRGISQREKARFRLIANLTRREMEILAYVSRGASNADIAEALFVSEGTVKSHVSNILRKLGKRDRTQLALYAVEKGLT
jgi:DNA-binding NarL/FixJ family response regulator